MSTAGAGGATEVCDAILLSMRARHALECVPVPFWHLGQPIEAPNFCTIAAALHILRLLAVIGVFACLRHRLAGVVPPLPVPHRLLVLQLVALVVHGLQTLPLG